MNGNQLLARGVGAQERVFFRLEWTSIKSFVKANS